MPINSTRSPITGINLNPGPAPAWLAMIGLGLFSALCILVHAGAIMRLAFPAGAFAVGFFLYIKYPILYLGFAWWIAFLTPFVRRLVDYGSGWVEPNPILLAPFLVMLVTIITFLRYLPTSYKQGSFPFVLAFIGVLYGLLVGLINNPLTKVVVPLLSWLTPIIFGFHLFVNWRDYPIYRQNTQRNFLWAVLITGAYGVVQYLIAPEWDRFWIINSLVVAFGTPEPRGIRVFSTLNSPAPFALVMMAGLLLLFNSKAALRFVAVAIGYLSFLLTLQRSVWVGWVVGLFILITSLKPRLQMRLIITIMIMAICVIPLLNIAPFSEVINSRLQTFSNTKDDVSYNQRTAGYAESLGLALSETMGEGLGYVLRSENLGSNDSGILTMFFTLGWFGTIPYISGMILLIFTLFRGSTARFDPFASAVRAISLGTLAQIGLWTVNLGLAGVFFWGFAGLGMAANKYYHQLPDD